MFRLVRCYSRYIFRICVGTLQKFTLDDCFYKASALTFYSLLSIVPILAIAFGIAKGFGFEKYLEIEVKSRLLEQPQLAEQVISFAYSMLERTHSGVIALIGVVSFLWTSIQLFSNMEHSLNGIWGIKKDRSFIKQIHDAFIMMIFGPLFMVASSSLLLYTIALFNKFSHQNYIFQTVSPYILFFLRFSPFIINWILFFFVYIFIPNTKVQWKYAAIAGIIAGSVYQIMEWIYIYFQIGVSSYGAIYGSFAALPLFLVWMNTSWSVLLAGAELATQLEIKPINSENKRYEWINKKQIVLWIFVHCTQEFLEGRLPPTIDQIAQKLGISTRTMQQISEQLFNTGILAEGKDNSLVITKNPDTIRFQDLSNLLDNLLIEKYPVLLSDSDSYYKALLNTNDNITLKEFVQSNSKDSIKV